MYHDESNVIYYPSSGDGGYPPRGEHASLHSSRSKKRVASGGSPRFTWSRLEIGTVTHRWFYLYAIVSALSVSERANLSSPVTSRDRVTPPSRRPTTTELSRVWYGELLLRIYCAIVPSSFFLFSSLPPPFLFRFRFSIQLIAKF